MVKVIDINKADRKEMFHMKETMLGDQEGNYIVVDGTLYLGRYVKMKDAEKHVSCLNNFDKWADAKFKERRKKGWLW